MLGLARLGAHFAVRGLTAPERNTGLGVASLGTVAGADARNLPVVLEGQVLGQVLLVPHRDQERAEELLARGPDVEDPQGAYLRGLVEVQESCVQRFLALGRQASEGVEVAQRVVVLPAAGHAHGHRRN